jgi:DNA-directed RNA polymerase specialized sigma24 family protein
VESDLAGKTDQGRAGELYRWPPAHPGLNRYDPVGEVEESDASHREFIERHSPSVAKVPHMILANHAHAAEIAPDAFVRGWVLTNGRDTRRSRFRRIFGIPVKECFRFLTATRSSYERVSHQTHPRRDLLKEALARIPAEDRHLLLLREIDGYSVAQLSEVTGLNEFAVKNRLFAKRRRLMKDLSCQAQA